MGPKTHAPGKLDFSARNPYATLDKNGDLLMSWVNSTVSSSESAKISWQRRSTNSGQTWGPDYDMKLGKLGGTLLGPGEGIVLGRHAPQSKCEFSCLVSCSSPCLLLELEAKSSYFLACPGTKGAS